MKNLIVALATLLLVSIVNAQKPFYCQAPLPNPSEDTDGMTLQMVQILTRHGDRTPLYNPMTVKMNDWNCSLGTYMYPSPNDMDSTIPSPSRQFRKVYLPGREYWPGNCSDGQLTSLGYEQHQQLGSMFRSLYVDKYGLLSQDLNLDEIWVRSTDVPRTLQSAQSEINALYPPSTIGGVNPIDVIDIHTMDQYYENMSPNTALCPYLITLLKNATASTEYQNFVQQNAALQKTIMNALQIKNAPLWSGFMDLFFASQCHGFPLPKGITQDIVNQTYEAAFYQNKFFLTFPMIARLGSSTFLEEILDNFRNFMNGNTTVKYFLFSGHDDSVAPFVNLFGLYQNWPPYASSVQLELWADSNEDYFLQFKYNGQSYQLNGCPSVMCPITTFFEISYDILVPDYQDVCSQSGSSSDDSGDSSYL